MKHILLILLLHSVAVTAQDPFHERFYNYLNKPVKTIRAGVKKDPLLTRLLTYRDAPDSLRLLTTTTSRELEITYFVFEDSCHYIAVLDRRLTPTQLLADFDTRYVKVNPEDFPYLYEEYTVEGQSVIGVYSDSSVNVGYMVISRDDRKGEAIFVMYSLWDDKAFGEF